MIHDLQYPEDAEKVIDSLRQGLQYDAAVAVLGNACVNLKLEGDNPDFSAGIKFGGRLEDEAVRKDAPILLSRFSLISMVSRFERHAQLLLLQRRVLEELGSSGKKMAPKAMWRILRRVQKEARLGPVKMCSELVIEKPSVPLQKRMNWLEGVYRVRNCLAHRLGKVEMIDVKQPGMSFEEVKDGDKLRAKWVRLKASFDGKEITSFPYKEPHSGKLDVKFEEYERQWGIGDDIQITPLECQGIAMSFSMLGNQVLADFKREMNTLLGIA